MKKIFILLLFPVCVQAQSWSLAAKDTTLIFTRLASTYLMKPLVTTSNGNNPTGTNSTTGVMAGLAKTFTPQASGRILIIISGQATNNTGDNGFKYDLRYGTGNAPANAAALTGTQVGSTISGSSVASSTTTAIPIMPFIHQGVVTGLTPGTTYWIDLGIYAVTGGTATFSSVNVTIIEL